MREFEKNEIVNVNSDDFGYADIYRTSNDLIRAKYTSTIEEANIMSIAQNKIYHGAYEVEQNGSVLVSFKANEYRNLLGSKGNSIYRNLKDASIRMTNKAVEISDDKSKNFVITSMVERASYINGVFSIRFAREFKGYLLETSSHATELDLKTTLSFEHYASKKLYEELKSYMYLSLAKKKDKEYDGYRIRFGLDELKFMFGLVDINDSKVQQVLRRAKEGQKPDYEAASAAAKKSSNKYKSSSEFRRSFIETAIQEINGEGKYAGKGTDIHIDMNVIKGGRGGAIKEFEFVVTNNTVIDAQEQPENTMSEDEMIDALIDMAEVKLNLSGARSILNAADWDFDRVEKAYAYLETAIGLENVKNFVGYMIDVVNGEYVVNGGQPEDVEQETQKKTAEKKASSGSRPAGRKSSAKKTAFADDDEYDDI